MGIKLGNTDIESIYLGSNEITKAYLGELEIYDGGPVFPLRVASTENRFANTTNASSGRPNQATRFPCVIGQDCRTLALSFMNWYMFSSGEINGSNTLDIIGASIESPSGTVVQVTFAGLNTKTLAAGDNDIVSDEIPASAFGESVFARGDTYFVKIALAAGGTGSVPYGRDKSGLIGAQVIWYDPATTTLSDITAPGLFTATGGTPATQNSGYSAILIGRPVSDGRSFIGIGDSILAGVGDNTNPLLGRGFFQRSMVDAAGANPMPAINFGRSSAGQNAFSRVDATKWRAYVKYARFAVEELGTNDIASMTAGNFAAFQSNYQNLWSILRANGAEQIIRTKLIAYASSTDQYKTTVNQTVQAKWGVGDYASLFNDWIDTQGGNVDYIVDPVLLRDPTDGVFNGKWNVNNTNNWMASESAHPSSNGHETYAENYLRPVTYTI